MRYGDRQSIEDTIVITKVPTRSYDRDRRTLMPQTGSSSSKPGKRQLQSSRRAGGRHSGDKDLGRGRSVGRRTWACTSEGAQARAEQVDDVLGAGVAQRLGSEQVP